MLDGVGLEQGAAGDGDLLLQVEGRFPREGDLDGWHRPAAKGEEGAGGLADGLLQSAGEDRLEDLGALADFEAEEDPLQGIGDGGVKGRLHRRIDQQERQRHRDRHLALFAAESFARLLVGAGEKLLAHAGGEDDGELVIAGGDGGAGGAGGQRCAIKFADQFDGAGGGELVGDLAGEGAAILIDPEDVDGGFAGRLEDAVLHQ